MGTVMRPSEMVGVPITTFATVPVSNLAVATMRTPRTGKLGVTFLLRNRATGHSKTIKSFAPRSVPGGSYSYSAKLSASDRNAIGSGNERLMVKSTLDTQNFPSRMLRSRFIDCDFCG